MLQELRDAMQPDAEEEEEDVRLDGGLSWTGGEHGRRGSQQAPQDIVVGNRTGAVREVNWV